MSTRTNILSALRTDFGAVTGLKKSWKFVQQLDKIPDSDFPSHYIGLGTAVNRPMGDHQENWEVPVMIVVYFSCDTDTNNSGKLETEAERLIELYLNTSIPTTIGLDAVISMDIVTITPYVNTGVENKGFLLIECKLNYIGE